MLGFAKFGIVDVGFREALNPTYEVIVFELSSQRNRNRDER
jgi:hypothetical protein